MTIELGDKVKDLVTGYTGIAIARTQWLQGCDRILVQAPVLADSKIPDDRAFDEPQLVIVKKGAAKPKAKKAKTGGPQRDASAYRR
jgi:hypothetical protein